MMKTFFSMFIVFGISLLPPYAFSTILEGTYLGAGSESEVVIERNDQGAQRFLMNILNSGHVCIDVAGSIIENQGIVDDEEDLGQCRLSFSQNNHILNVGIETYEECHQYCGMRASLEGSYRIPPQLCTLEEIAVQRDEFKQLYDQRQYKDAESRLNKLLSQCDFYLDFVLRDSIRNDLALTLYHQNQPELCIEVLSSTVALDQNVYLPLMEQEMYEDTERAIRFNWGLCSG